MRLYSGLRWSQLLGLSDFAQGRFDRCPAINVRFTSTPAVRSAQGAGIPGRAGKRAKSTRSGRPARCKDQEFRIFRKLGSKGLGPHERGFESGTRTCPAEDSVNARKGNQRASVSIDELGSRSSAPHKIIFYRVIYL